jgi:hypothetical protein
MSTITDVPQHIAALAVANDVRLSIATAKREIAQYDRPTGLAHLAELITEEDPRIERARLGDLLLAVHRFGPTKMRRFINANLRTIGAGERKRVSDLTPRQREALHHALVGESERTEW